MRMLRMFGGVAVLLLLLAGCGKGPPSVSLGKSTYKTGESITVTYSKAVAPPKGEQYWVTVVKAGAPDTEWGTWHYVKAGATSDQLPAAAKGNFEVRLHDGYPRVPNHVVSRESVTIE